MNILSVVASTVAGVLFLLLVTLRNERSYANRLLSPFILTFCLALLQSQELSGSGWAAFQLLSVSVFFLAGPSLYGYARYLFWQQDLARRDLLHLIPFMLILQMSVLALSRPELFDDFWWWQQRLLYVQLAGYSIAVLIMVKKARPPALNEFGDYQRTHFYWVSALCYCVLALLGLDTLMGITIYMLDTEVPMAHNIMMFAIAIVIIGLTFHALRQPLIMHGSADSPNTIEPDKKYHKSSLSESQASYYLNKLKQQMVEQQYYLDNELTLTSLAKHLDVSRHHLSQIINKNLNTTFYDYINALRVKQAQELLLNDQMSVTEVCFASGFANKGTFNNVFKKITSQTPSQWRKSKKTKTAA